MDEADELLEVNLQPVEAIEAMIDYKVEYEKLMLNLSHCKMPFAMRVTGSGFYEE